MTRVINSSLVRAAVLPVGLLIIWQLVVMFGTPSRRAPMPTHVVEGAWSLIGSGDLPLARLPYITAKARALLCPLAPGISAARQARSLGVVAATVGLRQACG